MKKGKRGNEQSLKIIGNKGPKKWINPMAGQNSKQKKKIHKQKWERRGRSFRITSEKQRQAQEKLV